MAAGSVWTIGHSNHSWNAFVGLLSQHAIRFIADVRSYPYSRVAPHFNREELHAELRDVGVRYLFFGEELGGRPARPEHYDDEGHALYGHMANERPFQEAVARLERGAAEHRIALLCSEGDPTHCHRRLLVGKVLAERGAVLHHVLPGGDLWTEASVDVGPSQTTLFGAETPWRSTQSVSHRRRLSGSSAG